MDPHGVEVSLGPGIELPLSTREVAEAARLVLERERVREAELSIAFLGDEEIARLNAEHLGHEGPTDVLSFPLTAPGGATVGDVYVGTTQAARQAGELGIPFREELLRLVIHGTLHVLGYDHPEGEDREGSPMYERQEELLREVLGRDPAERA